MRNHSGFCKNDRIDTIAHVLMFAVLFMLVGTQAPHFWLKYVDKTRYYKMFSPLSVERKENKKCDYVDVYIHRVALTTIKATSVRQLTLLRVDKAGIRQRIKNFTTDIQAEVGEATVIAHWYLPCDIPSGQYLFEGVVEYKIDDVTKYERFWTEQFNVVPKDG